MAAVVTDHPGLRGVVHTGSRGRYVWIFGDGQSCSNGKWLRLPHGNCGDSRIFGGFSTVMAVRDLRGILHSDGGQRSTGDSPQ
ncbi:hypothetical protein GDO81_018734 [Engystomops pustulosus]|uniref:Uncharacterized protein n=1 Tax=Engystomops pustulosus TaxID=76066 RepID=A0AAV6YJ23_ENGPU|nr:hypothetical protein GDO81_018734 [Engystomops pustulosus]